MTSADSTWINYFAYGSNMNPGRMRERTVEFSLRQSAVLDGYALCFNKISASYPGSGAANIVESPHSRVEGILYLVTAGGLAALDRFEGYPEHYTKETVRVETAEKAMIECVTYIANADMTKDGLKPRAKYLSHLLLADEMLTPQYLEMLRSQETV